MENMRPSDIVTMDSFENAILCTCGNFRKYKLSAYIFRQLHMSLVLRLQGTLLTDCTEDARYLLDVRPAGRWPAECFYYAGGVPAIMEEIKEHLHLGCNDCYRKDTWEKTWKNLKRNGFYEKCEKWLQEFNKRYQVNVTKEDIIRPYDKAIGTDGSIAVLTRKSCTGRSCDQTYCMPEGNVSGLYFVQDHLTVRKNVWMPF